MMVRFFAHGDGSGRAAVDYLVAKEVAAYTEDRKRIAGKTVRRDVAPEVLSGDPDLTCHLIDSNTRKWRYTSGVVAFHAEDNPSEAAQSEVMRDFEKAAFAGLEADQTNIFWVRHQHMGNIELHFLIPRVELYNGRSFNPAPPGSERFYNAFRDFWNAREGWVSPEELERKRMVKPVFDLGDRKSIKETIQTFMLQKIEAGAVRNHADVRAVLSELDGLEFKPLTEKQLEKRRKADAEEAKGGKPRRRDSRITMRVAGTSDSQNTFRLEDRIFHETWTADEYFAAKPASEGGDPKPRHRRANPADVERLRAAFVTNVERRAAKNRSRYACPRKAEQLTQRPDAHEIEAQASKIRDATAALEESRKEWRTVTWKTMLPTYLAGVCLTSWVLLMAVQLTFPEQPSRIETPGLATFGLEGTRVTRGLGGLGQVINLPPGVTLANCPVPNLGGGEVCVETAKTR